MRSATVAATLVLCCLSAFLAATSTSTPAAVAASLPNPDDGAVEGGVYANTYFGLSLPLPPGWSEGLAGPPPSYSGYYSLGMLTGGDGEKAMILVAAQDTFFAAPAFRNAAAMAAAVGQAAQGLPGTVIDMPPSEVTVAGRPFSRIDYNGVGLYRSTLITPIRCHLVSFNITAASAELRAAAVKSLDRLANTAGNRAPDPACKANQAPPEQLVTRVDPKGGAFAPYRPIPVRLIIDADGGVKHIHVIRAPDVQRTAIETALAQWRFRPPTLDGGATALETGLLVEFTQDGTVNYLPSERAAQH
jgi:hypothetical protein